LPSRCRWLTGGEDERLDRDHDHDLEEIEDRGDRITNTARMTDSRMNIRPRNVRIRMWPGEHVREESDAQRDQAHELTEDLQRHDQEQQRLRRLRDPALEVFAGAVPADPLECVKTKVSSASASVTESDEVAA
jgi:hypothetical protein